MITAPVELARMLGHMRSDMAFESEQFRAQWAQQLPNTPPPAAGNLWLVFRWQGLQTVSGPSEDPDHPLIVLC